MTFPKFSDIYRIYNKQIKRKNMKNVMIVMVMVLGTILVGCKSTKEETCDNTEVIEKMEMRKVENLKPSKSNRVLIDSIK